MDYLWLKAVHVAAVLIFTAGLIAQALGVAAGARGGTETITLVSRWDRRATTPAMILVWLSGALVASSGHWFPQPWLWMKLVLVVALTGLHGIQAGRLRRLRQGDRPQSGAGPFTVPIGIAIMVVMIAALAVVKPF